MKARLICVVVGILLVSMVSVSTAQDFDDVAPDESEQVLQLFSALSTCGAFHTAKLHSIAGLDVGVQLVNLIIPGDYKDWPDGPFSDKGVISLPYLQANLGLPLKFEAFGRFFHYPMGTEPSREGVTFIGFGLKRGILQAPLLPKVAVMATYHSFFVPDVFNFGTVSNIAGRIIASQDFLIFNVYGGIGYDYTQFKLEEDAIEVDENTDGVHGNIGIQINPFPLLHVYADYHFADFAGFTIGAGLSFR